MVIQSTHLSELKEIILSRIARILDQVYHEPALDLSLESVSARLAFKADPHLNELRLALERMERNEYGHCIFCKEDIPLIVLRDLPTAHFCERCASSLRMRTRTEHADSNTIGN